MAGGRGIDGSAEAGFSLLEVLVVVAILSVSAYVAIDTVDHDTSQMRYELTETRLAKARRGIVGDPALTVNGAPMVAGYVADIGQLPPCLEALFEQVVECNPNISTDDLSLPGYADFSDTTPTASAGVFVDADVVPGFSAGDSVLLAAGWRGPYVSGSLATFVDAWGNGIRGEIYPALESTTFTESGWEIEASTTTFSVATLGRNRAEDTVAPSSIYDVDTAMVPIVQNDWNVNLSGVQLMVTVTNDGTTDESFSTCVGLIAPDPGDATRWTMVGATELVADNDTDPDPTIQTLVAGTSETLVHTFTASDSVTIGMRTAVRYDPDGTDCTFTMIETQDPVFPRPLDDQRTVQISARVTPASVTFNPVVLP